MGTVNISPLVRQGGLIDRDMERRARRVRAVSRPPVGKTGNLFSSGKSEALRRDLGWRVVFDVPYALWIIRGRRFSPQAGRVISARAGPRDFLSDALRAAL